MALHYGRWMLDIGWLIVLLILLSHFLRDRKTLLQAQSWLKVKGRITSCEWVEQGHSIWPKIEYSYQVYDKDLVGEHLFLDTKHNSPNSKYSRLIAYKAAVAYKENAEIDVYYNPNNPEQSALDVAMPSKLNIILLLIAAMLVIHLGIMIFRLLG
ncbi:DUF3592 domain-containing protein [Legionella maioricensis]|uniref:DUF3592 domain-containing protein n=1 Tax=Legionella maioricensis TaxID=2896528 RepID=A0A9X2D108_9GAMM|nr:DUF3592 domain-containing protein [Legionella maioricensis]MCL9684466.1 DUF3592 domain-containing protein [Legionella maioricensis]MCL9688831.1 DUF3592 domain-containing protein [Legionella maioricensis]